MLIIFPQCCVGMYFPFKALNKLSVVRYQDNNLPGGILMAVEFRDDVMYSIIVVMVSWADIS